VIAHNFSVFMKGNTMIRLVTSALLLVVVSSGALGQSVAHPKHLVVFKTQRSAQQRCPRDRIVWADTMSRRLHLPGDHHFAHTHGGFACESEAIARGYHGPTTHT
jgi:hypothetical protein